MVESGRDPRVDAYIAQLPDWQQAICREVRELVHAADGAVQETIKHTTQPYFVLDGNVCALLATKDHVNVFIYDPTVPRPGWRDQSGARQCHSQDRADLPGGPDQPARPAEGRTPALTS